MNVQLTVVQLWALVAGGPIAMVLTVLIGILINNSSTKSEIARVEGTLKADMGSLRSELQRVEGVLGTKLDVLAARVKALEDEVHSPLVKQ